ncbi:adenylate cyclase [Nitzschia inconspicua]|uniref:Phosphodiesterase n=1 Tax=Nitzschia inconspicua TaxID=303405 RepID=A0A9K3M7J1_9STRA|nr:adenylate cyclase [Nitzschia inconspicua]
MKIKIVSASPAELEEGRAGSSSHDESSDNTGSEFATSSSSYQSGAKSKGGESLGQGETAAVNRSKFLVYLALLGAAVAVSTATYLLLSKEEQNTMRIEFQAHSQEILKQASANSVNMFEEIHGISKAITSHALDNGMTWPNVTLPHFDVRASPTFSKFEMVGFAPFVSLENKQGWEAYSKENQGWIKQDYFYRNYEEAPQTINEHIHPIRDTGEDLWFDRRHLVEYNYSDPATFQYEIPLWQVSPPPNDTFIVNMDLASHPVVAHLLWDSRVKKVKEYSRAIDLEFLLENATAAKDGHPRGIVIEPIFDDFHEDAEVVGFMLATLNWDNIFDNVVFDSVAPVVVEIHADCSSGFSYHLTKEGATFLGKKVNIHDKKFDNFNNSKGIMTPVESREGYPPVIHSHRPTDTEHDLSHCTYTMSAYPTLEFEQIYSSTKPIWFATMVASIFVCTAMVFIVYDILVQKRQKKLMSSAKRSNAIVSSLFPKEVQEKLMNQLDEENAGNMRHGRRGAMADFLDEANPKDADVAPSGSPIADIFTDATVMFADIAGFTAWSSTREPSQVFVLLESIYAAFDAFARKRKVFKVETIGDCYVAVTGVPHPHKDHAVLMAKFARDCMAVMHDVLGRLETNLGPDTTELGIRIGLNSGPVTAGVLRGDRARFQLFGDTVNTASRIETTGQKNRIHISEETAALLKAAGKECWVEPRKDTVRAKGKGELKTYWLKTSSHSVGTVELLHDTTHIQSARCSEEEALRQKHERLVKWISEILGTFLKQIIAKRKKHEEVNGVSMRMPVSGIGQNHSLCNGGILEEVQDVIKLPKFDPRTCVAKGEIEALDPAIATELYQYIDAIESMYCNNPFHSFEHAAHVTMSVMKLLSRIVAPESDPHFRGGNEASALHDHTYGITSDPLTQFSVVFSALIHDFYHPGVANKVLMNEDSKIAALYNNKSIAEQKSVDGAWQLLMRPTFEKLRGAIYTNTDEYNRFRQLVVNCVMATDIVDKDLSAIRRARWEVAFTEQANNDFSELTVNRRATIVIEHLIQASDVVHTMQHWHVYSKWNEKLFHEMYNAYQKGRLDTNPADNWYEGEIAFFDYYIIPLAKKLHECGVFGVFSDEYLTYALKNRREWEQKGKRIVSEMLSTIAKKSQPSVG